MTGTVFDIQRFSIHDGPGIRTVVFFKGCPLNCLWCHNPESKQRAPELSFVSERCLGCGACVAVCPEHCHAVGATGHDFRRMQCRRCGACADACPVKALDVIGRDMSEDAIMADVIRDRPFYEATGGGMTLSGGEPLMQPDFALALLREAKARKLHTCVETCGFADWADVRRIGELTDLFLFDCKESDSARHKAATGAPLEPIVENLRRLDEAGGRTVLRCPIVPGLNDRDDHWRGIAALAGGLRHIEAIELIPYHPMGASKALRIGADASLAGTGVVPTDAADAWAGRLQPMVAIPVRSP